MINLKFKKLKIKSHDCQSKTKNQGTCASPKSCAMCKFKEEKKKVTDVILKFLDHISPIGFYLLGIYQKNPYFK